MNIREMHYAFKIARNKIDSQQYRNYEIPEIDWLLNSAIDMFIKMTFNPRYNPLKGFEKSSRNTDDLKTLVKKVVLQPYLNPNKEEFVFQIPDDYNFFIKAEVTMYNNVCGEKKGIVFIQQHDDEFKRSPFDESSYLWGEVNGVFDMEGLRIFTDGNFSIKELFLTYLMKHPYVHNAKDYRNGFYYDLKGNRLNGSQDCILPEHTHSEIIDVAVLLATQYLQIPDYELQINKLKLT